MKLTYILFLVTIFNAYGSKTYSQFTKLNLDMNDASIQSVLSAIEGQSEFFFLYSSKMIDVTQKVNIHAESKNITEVLDELLAGKEIKYTVKNRQILLLNKEAETDFSFQQQKVTGKVKDATTGEGMAGVNVVVKGTSIGTITDNEGNYSLSGIDRNAIIVFTFIGYTSQEIPLNGRSILDVAFESETTGLEEVVVIGYGTAKKQTLTGSVSSIRADEIITTKTTNLAGRLQGKVAGLQIRQRTAEPGTFTNMISVRGFGTPLLVIDGVVRDDMSHFQRLNSEDIESISVLKDASAAIYGMNADNGVIIVTTKKGAAGKPKFTYSSMGIFKTPTHGSRQESVDAYTFRVLKNEMDKNSGSPLTYTQEELDKWEAGTEPGYQDTDWYNLLLKDVIFSHQHNFSVAGGNDNIKHYTSFGYLLDDGWAKATAQYYKKYNFRSNIDINLTKGLTAKLSFAGKYDDRKTPPGSAFLYRIKQIIVADRGKGIHTLANPNHFSVVPAENVNPVAILDESVAGYNADLNFQYQSTLDLNYELPFIKGLSFGIVAAYDGNIGENKQLQKGYTLYDYLTDTPGATPLTTLENTVSNYTRMYFQGKISYSTTIGQAHNISALLVSELRKMDTRWIGAKRQWDDVYTHDIINQGSQTNLTNAGGWTQEAFISYVGRLNYDYKNKYLLEFSFREDGSYRYAPSRRWAFFPAGSAGWRVSEEAFIKNNLPSVSNLKIRGSYGLMGADAGSAFQYYEGYSFGSVAQGFIFNDNVLTLGMRPPGVINENLTWIKTKTVDIGVDLELWKGKLGLTADVFQKNRDGLLASRAISVPNTFGASFPQENLNSDKYRGYELEITHKNKFGDFNYSVGANVSYARRYLLKVERAPYTSTYQMWKDDNNGNGRVQGRLWLYETEGVYTDITQYETAPLYGGNLGNSKMLPGEPRWKDLNGDGIFNANDQLPEGWAFGQNPPLQFGAYMNASWKGLDLYVLFQGSSLSWAQLHDEHTCWGYGVNPNLMTKFLDRWRTADPAANPFDPASEWIPGKWEALSVSKTGRTVSTALKAENRWAWDATYLRLKSIELGYTLPAKITRKINLDNVRFFLNTYNLYTFCQKDLKFYDPEKQDDIAQLYYPLMAEYNFGVSINF